MNSKRVIRHVKAIVAVLPLAGAAFLGSAAATAAEESKAQQAAPAVSAATSAPRTMPPHAPAAQSASNTKVSPYAKANRARQQASHVKQTPRASPLPASTTTPASRKGSSPIIDKLTNDVRTLSFIAFGTPSGPPRSGAPGAWRAPAWPAAMLFWRRRSLPLGREFCAYRSHQARVGHRSPLRHDYHTAKAKKSSYNPEGPDARHAPLLRRDIGRGLAERAADELRQSDPLCLSGGRS